MTTELKIFFLDINSIYQSSASKTEIKISPENPLESPLEILDCFFNNHDVLDFEKKSEEDILKYYFIYQIEEGITVSCNFYILTNLNKELPYSINAVSVDAYIIICDVEEKDTKIKIEKIFKYIEDNTDLNAQKSLIGVYVKKPIEQLNENNMKELINNSFFKNKPEQEQDQIVRYYQMCIGDENDNIKKSKQRLKDKEDVGELNKVLDKVFLEIYRYKKEGPHKRRKSTKDNTNAEDYSNGCSIF